MKFNYSPAPNYRAPISTKRIMRDLLLGLLVVYLFSLYYYAAHHGMNYLLQAVVIMVSSVVSCVGTEVVWALCNKKDVKSFLSSSFPWITGVILALMMPINVHWYAVAVSGILCILFGKLVFGGFGQNIFNPAAVGRAFIFAAFTGLTVAEVTTGATPTTLIANTYNWFVTDASLVTQLLKSVGGLSNLFFGFYPGALGETSALVIVLVGIYLAVRRVIDWRVPVVYVGGVFVITLIMALVTGMGVWYPVYHVLTGGLIFGAVFMATDPVTTPTSAAGRCIYALGCAVLTVLIRVKANLPEGVLYSILIMNACTPMIERVCDCEQIKGLKNSIITFAAVAVIGLGACVLAINAKEPAMKEVKPTVVNTEDFYMDILDASVASKTTNADGSVTVHVVSEGFAALSGKESNEFDITIKDKAVVSVVVTKCADTPYVGDKIMEESFLNQFVGLTKKDLEVDVAGSATVSTASTVKAVFTALGK